VSPGLDWILAALRHAPITTLALAMSRGGARTWDTVLPRMAAAAPRLTSLILTQVDVAVEPAVLAVLLRLPNLTSLEISYLYPLWGSLPHPVPVRPHPPLHNLVSLRAPPVLIDHFLSRTDALPALCAVCLLWKAPPRLNLPALLHFLSTITSKLAARAQEPQLSVCIDARGGLAAQHVVWSSELFDTAEIAAGCARVERVQLELNNITGDAYLLPRLVALFPRATCIVGNEPRGSGIRGDAA
jgi:hypothetical protein